MKTTKAQRDLDARLANAFDAGCDYYTEAPDENLITIYRLASKRYPDEKAEMIEFAYGYSVCRGRTDEKRREQTDE